MELAMRGNLPPLIRLLASSEAALHEWATVGDDSSSWSPPDLSHVWKHLADHGYAVIEDWSIGLTDGFLTKFHKKYFTNRKLRLDEGDWPRDRKRARDVIHYTWAGTRLRLREYATIALSDRSGIKGTRLHKRVRVLADPMAEHPVRTLLCLVPPARRKPVGTFGINFFRTFTDVVTKPHHDDQQFIILYVMHRKGDGARSYLYRAPENPDSEAPDDDSPGELVLDRQLNPGELLIFEDKLFKHGATPLMPTTDGTAMRDVLVCTVDYDEAYLKSVRPRESSEVRTELATVGIRD